MYKNTVIQTKGFSYNVCCVARANGSIYWSDKDITRGKKKSLPEQTGLTEPTHGRESM